MLFLFVTYLGYWAYKRRNAANKNILILGIIYITSFALNGIVEFITGKRASLKETLLELVRGTPGNIWIIYGLLVFCVMLLLYDKIKNNKIKEGIKAIGWVYSIIAICLFCYANIYSGIICIDNGLALNLFYRILGTNRSPYILCLPFMYLGTNIAVNGHNWIKIHKRRVIILAFLLWCLEVIVLQWKTNNYNIHMTLSGAAFIVSAFSYADNMCSSSVNNKCVILSLFLFSIQYSITIMCFTIFNISTLPMSITFFALYTLFIAIAFLICNRRNDDQKNI